MCRRYSESEVVLQSVGKSVFELSNPDVVKTVVSAPGLKTGVSLCYASLRTYVLPPGAAYVQASLRVYLS